MAPGHQYFDSLMTIVCFKLLTINNYCCPYYLKKHFSHSLTTRLERLSLINFSSQVRYSQLRSGAYPRVEHHLVWSLPISQKLGQIENRCQGRTLQHIQLFEERSQIRFMKGSFWLVCFSHSQYKEFLLKGKAQYG